jgi:UDP-glucose 4-epimerase
MWRGAPDGPVYRRRMTSGARRVVVVGATGNVGTAVLGRLETEPDVAEVAGVARRIPDASAAPYAGVEWHPVDIGRGEAMTQLTEIVRGADAVVHLAWLLQPNRDERAMWATNVAGTARVLEAVAAAGVPQVVVASSVGAYSVGPKRRAVDESWPTGGVHSSHYGRHKAAVERMLDRFEREHPDTVVTRMRPGLVMHGRAASEIRRLFVGPVVPVGWIGRVWMPVVPLPSSTVSQVVHASDLADAIARAVVRRAGGAFNVATDPVVTPAVLADVVGGRHLPVRREVVRALVWLAWKARLVAVDPGWIDLATTIPVMDTSRARTELGWRPEIDARAALEDFVRAFGRGESLEASPRLRRHPDPDRT